VLRTKAEQGDVAAARELREWHEHERAEHLDPMIWLSLCTSAERSTVEKIARRAQRRATRQEGGQIGESEDAVDHLLFLLFEHTRFLARCHQHLQP